MAVASQSQRSGWRVLSLMLQIPSEHKFDTGAESQSDEPLFSFRLWVTLLYNALST
jgi:hypothetical protein